MSISNPSKLQLCPYPHLSNHFMANSKPSKLCFFGLFLFSENYGYFQRSYSNLAFMSISIWLSPNYIFSNNYGYFHMPFYTDPKKRPRSLKFCPLLFQIEWPHTFLRLGETEFALQHIFCLSISQECVNSHNLVPK